MARVTNQRFIEIVLASPASRSIDGSSLAEHLGLSQQNELQLDNDIMVLANPEIAGSARLASSAWG